MLTNNEHSSWKLPLFGGAELNRLRRPPPIYLTSRPYPVHNTDTISTLFTATGLTVRKWPANMDTSGTTFAFTGVSMTAATTFRDVELSDTTSSMLAFVGASMTAAIGNQYIYPEDYGSTTLSVMSMTRERTLIIYSNAEPYNSGTTLSFIGVTIT